MYTILATHGENKNEPNKLMELDHEHTNVEQKTSGWIEEGRKQQSIIGNHGNDQQMQKHLSGKA
jgi:hypothetical protein